ncbi:response regulator transcription factor [Lysobacter niastensis]|uniref:response regulator transcription factor n=1 Tax=Lysobacter niastensis TaxID=380629 RepID=UPI001E5865A5|nr:response regulator transcription factor [Lysobacter niastensis]
MMPGIGIIMLTGHGATSDQVRGLSQGADAYLVKPAQVELLAATVHSLMRRLKGLAPPRASKQWQFEINDWSIVSPMGCAIPLTNTEQRVMTRLVSRLGQLVTRDQLVSAVADNVHDFDPHRIEMVIHRLRRKVQSRCGEPLPLTSVHGKGYVLENAVRTVDRPPGK